MDIRINYIELCNFKGVRSARFDFGGKNATIQGDNGVGKSTIFDAFTWLLFGKDHRDNDQSHFDIKTIDPETKEPIHHLEHWVQAELVVDGARQTLKRTWEENWVKPRGEVEQVLKGHSSSFYLNGLELPTKKDYDATIGQWINESVFRLITNPHYFIDDSYTSWTHRRATLLEMLDEAPERKEVKEQFADLIAKMNGELLQTFRKRIAQEKKVARENLRKAQSAIDALVKALPKMPDVEAINATAAAAEAEYKAQAEVLEAKIKHFEDAIADVAKANAAKYDALKEIDKQLVAVRYDMCQVVNAHLAEAEKQEARIREMKRGYDKQLSELSRLEQSKGMIQADIERMTKRSQNLSEDFKAMREKHNQVAAQEFDESAVSICPVCKQQLPILQVDQIRAQWKTDRSIKLTEILLEANNSKDERNKVLAEIEVKQKELETLNTDIKALAENIEGLKADIAKATANTINIAELEAQAKRSPEFLELAQKEHDLLAQSDAIAGQTISALDLTSKQAELRRELATLQKDFNDTLAEIKEPLSALKEDKRIRALIAEEEATEARFAEALASLERTEFQAEQYAKADADSVAAVLQSMFKIARWKMTDETLDGGLIECCEVTDDSSVPYRSLNDARKIQVGMDVIAMFSKRYNCFAPVFIDNAESITTRDFETPAQIICLEVVKGAELQVIKHS